MNRFFNAIRWTDYYWLQQWIMDSWQWNSKLADFWFLKTFSLNVFGLTVYIAFNNGQLKIDSWHWNNRLTDYYCLLPIALKFTVAVSDSLKTFSLNTFIQSVRYCHWGVAPSPTSFFVLTQKRRQKRSRLRPFRSKNGRSEGSNRPTCWSSMILL